eukprot:750088-Hanusia_phi.AAC.4
MHDRTGSSGEEEDEEEDNEDEDEDENGDELEEEEREGGREGVGGVGLGLVVVLRRSMLDRGLEGSRDTMRKRLIVMGGRAIDTLRASCNIEEEIEGWMMKNGV